MFRLSLIVGLSALLSIVAVPVHAQRSDAPCTSDAECADGEFCVFTPCAEPCDTTDPACQPTTCGGFCEARAVAPVACATDDDCTDGEVCITQTYEECSGSGCACASDDPTCDCPPPTEPTCTSHTESSCGPAWLAPCVVDEDCGGGFTCEAIATCDCPVSSDGTPAPDCGCPPSEDRSCVLQQLPCTSDAECPDGLLCQAIATSAPCVVDDNGNTACEAEPAPASMCAPAGYFSDVRADNVAAESGPTAADASGTDDDTGAARRLVLSCANSGIDASLSPLAAWLAALPIVRRLRRTRR